MTTRRKKAPDRGIAAADINAQIVASLTSAVLAVDGEGRVLTANDAVLQHLELEAAPAPGTPLGELAAAQPLLSLYETFQNGREVGYVSRKEIGIQTSEGRKTLGVTASLLQGPDAFNGVIFLFTDLTRIRHLERIAELNRQLAQIGALTAGVVHELRNPLSVITGMTELLARRLGEDNPLHKNAAMVLQEAAQLDRLISQFLSFARPFELEVETVKSKQVIDRAMQWVEHVAKAKQVELRLESPKRLPELQTDPGKTAQALANLLRNAIEIVPMAGWVRLRCAVEKGELVFTVEDNGPGIHIEEGENLFTPFVTKKEGGTGLGLSIVHRIITAQGGDAGYGNLPEGGAWFQIRLPLQERKT